MITTAERIKERFQEAIDLRAAGKNVEAFWFQLGQRDAVDDFGDKELCGKLRNGLGASCVNLEDHEGAIKYFTEAHDLFQSVGTAIPAAGALNNIAAALIALNRIDEAFEYLDRAEVIFIDEAAVVWRAQTEETRAKAYIRIGDYWSALAYAAQSVARLSDGIKRPALDESIATLELALKLLREAAQRKPTT
jgi:tetratricopeptide (TPR) repeat protein